MSRVLAFPDSAKSELRRLDAAQREALRGGDPLCLVHSRLLWCELLLTLYPRLAVMAPNLVGRIAHLLPGASAVIPRWKRELLARPLVPVVRRKLTTCKLPGGSISHGAEETLACGHTHKVIVLLDGDIRVRRRRCKQCGATRLAAADRRDGAKAPRRLKYGNR
jgi:hypothetical protein